MPELKSGQCVCGAVSYTIVGEPKRVTICHCRWCQRRTGSAFGVEVVFEASQITINDRAVSRYRHLSDESGRWLDQHFCAKCGANIGFTLEAVPGIRTIAAGTFDDHPGCSRTGTSDGTYSHAQLKTGRLSRTTLKAMKTISDRIKCASYSVTGPK